MIVSFLIGLLIGILYFGGLYYTTQKFNHVKSPGLFMILSFIFRMGILLTGLYYLAQAGFKNILLGFLAIMIVRMIMVSKIKKDPSKPDTKRE
ncbi:ATP synthase subunit I [Jeotgalibaca sp. MA1X17-3]|uniref:ATP synthase subunit I n=1 Tax=Jeotgalibaca sp. MA1X17-3 TaxID=2908211 RepID=UPI001F365A95|nr:ATP synthase subunit I [Jeotgalibaca sp. MA1X17-3]UJF16455.1 ATP synthase subunit I [Jeotgalibaca sp. MA1X17-3]